MTDLNLQGVDTGLDINITRSAPKSVNVEIVNDNLEHIYMLGSFFQGYNLSYDIKRDEFMNGISDDVPPLLSTVSPLHTFCEIIVPSTRDNIPFALIQNDYTIIFEIIGSTAPDSV